MGFLSSVTSLVAQPGVQAIGAGLLSGVVGGTALVASGALPLGGQAVTTLTVELLACPDTGPPLGTISDGSQLLVTGRNGDGSWLEVYIGQPGIDRAWAPATSLALEAAADTLPVSDCAAPTPGPLSTPAATVEATVEVTTEPLPTEPLATEPAPPTPSPTPTPRSTRTTTPTKTPAPPKTPTATATPTKTPSATPTPTPTPFIDQTNPEISNLRIDKNCIGSDIPQALISVDATDNVAVTDVYIAFTPPGGTGGFVDQMGQGGGDTWNYVITAEQAANSGWQEGYVDYSTTAVDANTNESPTLHSDNNSDTTRLYYAAFTCTIL